MAGLRQGALCCEGGVGTCTTAQNTLASVGDLGPKNHIGGNLRADCSLLSLNSKAQYHAEEPYDPDRWRLRSGRAVKDQCYFRRGRACGRSARGLVASRTMMMSHEGSGSSPETKAELVDNTITTVHAHPDVSRLMVDLGDEEPPALPFSRGAGVRQRGHSSPMPQVPLPRPFQGAGSKTPRQVFAMGHR